MLRGAMGPWANTQSRDYTPFVYQLATLAPTGMGAILESASSDPWRAQGPMAPPLWGGENTATESRLVAISASRFD